LKVARVYFTAYSDEEYDKILEMLREKFKDKIIVHKSVVLREFRYIEILNFNGDSEELEEMIKNILGRNEYVKIDIVEVVKPKR